MQSYSPSPPPASKGQTFIQVHVNPLEREQAGQQFRKRCPVTLELYLCCVFILSKSDGGRFK